ncbi:MAG: ribonuclease R [Rhodospirillaceae bacterium]|nr:ribonuclease R [Rhodospirillaceae bacterium]
MTQKQKTPPPFPGREEILKFIEETPGRVGKREIARAFRLDSAQKMQLKKLLKEMKEDGQIQRNAGRRFTEPGSLPPAGVVVIIGPDTDGEIRAEPMTWDEETPPPAIYMAPERRGSPALAPGDRVLARLTRGEDKSYEGRTIRRIGSAAEKILGIYTLVEGQGRLKSISRKARGDYFIARGDSLDAREGDLVRCEVLPGRRTGLRLAKVLERLDTEGEGTSISLIAIHDHDIPYDFSSEALELAAAAKAAPLGKREDLRNIPLVTIDGADARDFDDAVFAEPDPDKKNPGGWHLIVAIADVAWYVRPGDALDIGAYTRSNSVYFPDRVVPMLPEALSNGWCSLVPDEERPCMAAHMWINAEGQLTRHHFVRALMRSHARLTYEQVQAARDGNGDENTAPLTHNVIAPLYGAYEALNKARHKRGVLELDLPERRIVIGTNGQVERVEMRERFDSHKLIEEFMVTANVAAAETLEKKRQPCMYRIHDEPSMEKIESLRQFLDSLSIRLAKGQVIRAETFNRILEKVKDTPNASLVNDVVLRSQSQAEYNPDNIGHFGLALRRYCHFTSPIRRYADLLVHRALIRGLGLGEGGLADDSRDFARIGESISKNERRAAAAERSSIDRFCALFLAEKVGSIFPGKVNGVTRFGLFVTLDDTGADGLVPLGSLPDDYYVHDETRHLLRGRRSKKVFRLGDKVDVMLMEADPLTGSMIMQVINGEALQGSKKVTTRARNKPSRAKIPVKKSKSKSRAGRRKSRAKH